MNAYFLLLLILGTLLTPRSLPALVTVPGALTHEQKAVKKESIQGTIPIQNEGNEAVTVKISLKDYSFTAEGESSFPPAGTSSRSNSSWITFGTSQVTVAPHSTYNFSYSLKVPDESSLQGTYWSIFLIEPVEEEFTAPDKKQSLGVKTIIRYGVQIITHIGNIGTYDLKILDKKILTDDTNKTFILHVENSGTQMQTPLLLVELIDAKGVKIGRFTADKQRILPSCSVNYRVDISSAPPGKYKAMTILDHGEAALFGAQYDIEIR